MEFSKKLVIIVLIIFGVSMVASYALPVTFSHLEELCISIFQIVATLAGSTLVAYFGKAGFENYDKNKRRLGFEKNSTDSTQIDKNDEETGGGAG